MSDPTIAALQALVKREGGHKAVALVIGANDQSIYQIVAGIKTKAGRPKGVGKDLREKLQRHYPDWMNVPAAQAADNTGHYHVPAVQTITPASSGESQHMRLSNPTMPPPRIPWEGLMHTNLPREFETELPDNAMAPAAPRATRVIFITGVQPEAGDWVLLRDGAGQLHCREYRVVRADHWQAHAVNPAVAALDSQADQLAVLAVYDGMRGRRAPR
jgi:hypothetical protein